MFAIIIAGISIKINMERFRIGIDIFLLRYVYICENPLRGGASHYLNGGAEMPQKPKRPCRYPGCPGFCEQGQVFCKDHRMYSDDRMRGGASARGYDARWREARAIFLKQHPLCAFCQAEGKIVPATVVDHIIPHWGDQRLFWDQTNLESLCKECHDKKTGSGL